MKEERREEKRRLCTCEKGEMIGIHLIGFSYGFTLELCLIIYDERYIKNRKG
jgi:hypothetical protein